MALEVGTERIADSMYSGQLRFPESATYSGTTDR